MATHSSILAGKSQGQRNLVGYSPQCLKEPDRAEHEHANKLYQTMAMSRSADNGLTIHDKHKVRGTCKCVVIWEQNLKPEELISAAMATSSHPELCVRQQGIIVKPMASGVKQTGFKSQFYKLICCVTFDNLLYLSVPQFLHCIIQIITGSTSEDYSDN